MRKKIISSALFGTLLLGGSAFAQTPVITVTPQTSVQPTVQPTAPAPTSAGIGSDISAANKDAEAQIKALRQEMETKIKAIREEYAAKIKAIRDTTKAKVSQLKDLRDKAKELERAKAAAARKERQKEKGSKTVPPVNR